MKRKIRLGVNIDHIATLRQARGGAEPSVLDAARAAIRGGADGITVHLREDRRHIQDRDVDEIKRKIRRPLNLEMALDAGILRIALRVRPDYVCLVPEKRRELTTEGGLDACAKEPALRRAVRRLHRKGIAVSLFLDPSVDQIKAAARTGADAVEIHTGAYANASGARRRRELARIRKAAGLGASLGLRMHAGHGLNDQNTKAVVRIPEIEEVNIGHSIIARAVFTGLRKAVQEMKALL